MSVKIKASRVKYSSEHSPDLTSTRVIPVMPDTRRDIHEAFERTKLLLCEFGAALVDDGHMTKEQFIKHNFKWNPIKKKLKRQTVKQKVKFVTGKKHRLKHIDGEIYTVEQLIHMVDSKVFSTQKHDKKLLEDFTEAMLLRFNLSLKWFGYLAEKYYGKNNNWTNKIKQAKIDIDWV